MSLEFKRSNSKKPKPQAFSLIQRKDKWKFIEHNWPDVDGFRIHEKKFLQENILESMSDSDEIIVTPNGNAKKIQTIKAYEQIRMAAMQAWLRE